MGDLTYNQEGGNSIPISILTDGTSASIELRERDSCESGYGALIEFFFSTQVSTSVASRVEEILRVLRDIGVKIPNPAEIKRYLRRYDDMLELVLEVCQLTRGCFPPSTELSLEVYRDPEVEDEHLTLYVRQRPYDANLMKKLKGITPTYLDELAYKSGWLSVTTDFRFPRYQDAL